MATVRPQSLSYNECSSLRKHMAELEILKKLGEAERQIASGVPLLDGVSVK